MRLDRDGEIINDDFNGYGGFTTIDVPEVASERMEHLRNNPYQRVVRVVVPLDRVHEFRDGDLPEEYITLPSGTAIDYERITWTTRDLAQQSGSSYQFEVLSSFGVTADEAIEQIGEGLRELGRRWGEIDHARFVLGRWDDCTNAAPRESLEKSRQVLIEHLNENQKVDFLHRESFAAIGSESGHYYEILPYDAFGIRYIDKDIFMCATTKHQVPIYDEMLINKLYLETDEYGFVRKCNFKDPWEAEKLYDAIGLKEKAKQSWVSELAGYMRSYGR